MTTYSKHPPLVSVIVPVYNVAPYLAACLDSVLGQTLQDIEIICVDDGSTDKSAEILQTYKTAYPTLKVLQQSNQGAGAARNTGLAAATGEYLAFLDGDDYFVPTCLQKMYQKAKSVQADIAICSAASYHVITQQTIHMDHSLQTQHLPACDVFNLHDMPNYLFNSFQNWNWNKLFKRSFIVEHDIHFQPLRRTNDLYFTCCALALAQRICVVKEDLVIYRVGMSTNLQATNLQHPLDFYEAFKKLKKFLVTQHLYPLLKQSYLNWTLDGILYNLLSIHNDTIRRQIIDKILTDGQDELGLSEITQVQIYNQKFLTTYNKIVQNPKRYLRSLKYTALLQNIFSIQNSLDKKYKEIVIFGVKIKIKRFQNNSKKAKM